MVVSARPVDGSTAVTAVSSKPTLWTTHSRPSATVADTRRPSTFTTNDAAKDDWTRPLPGSMREMVVSPVLSTQAAPGVTATEMGPGPARNRVTGLSVGSIGVGPRRVTPAQIATARTSTARAAPAAARRSG